MIFVICLDTLVRYDFVAVTPYEAITKMKYTLDIQHSDKDAVINKTPSGLHLWMEHSGKTYAVRNA